MNKAYRCLTCGYYKESAFDLSLECPICQDDLKVEIDLEEGITDIIDGKIASLLKEEELEQMKVKIKLVGNDIAWDIIEKIRNPFERIEERKLFIEAGGKIPEKGIKI